MTTRRGFTLLEILVSCVLLATLLTLCLQLVGVSAAQRKSAGLRETALLEAANALERVYAGRWEDLTPETAGRLSLSDQAASSLPGGNLTVEVQTPEDDPAAKRIAVEVRWEPGRGKPPEHVRLVAWKYRDNNHAESR
jgi:prepilin-type N-terminal cleavage/methylation domain-containing protein